MNREYSIIIVSFNDGKLIENSVKPALQSNASRIIISAGGKNTDIQFINEIKDQRLIFLKEDERLGKARAINRCLPYAKGDFLFILGGDLKYSADVFQNCITLFSQKTGVVAPRVQPEGGSGLSGVIGRLMWRFHHAELGYMAMHGRNSHGGEFLAFRREIVDQIPDVINDDAYICLQARRKGMNVVYAPEMQVRNCLPLNLHQLISQRVRVNYGHIQLSKLGLDPGVMDSLLFSNFRDFLRIIWKQIRDKPEDAFILPLAMMIELISIVIARKRYERGMDYSIWPILERGYV